MILVDTSIWVDHLREGDARLARLLARSLVCMHPFVLGEIACGSLQGRGTVLALLHQLPGTATAQTHEVLAFIENRALQGQGLGWVDAHLLAATAISTDRQIWTRDRRLAAAAARLGLAWAPEAA